MECAECGASDASLTKVEYEIEETETLPLCADCRSEFRDGGFVESLTVLDE